jgi:hypothetical protein
MKINKKQHRLLAGIALVLAFGSVHAQQQSLDSLIKKLGDYNRSVFTEKIFVHTDRSFYLTGETMWFKIYDVDGSFHRPLALSRVAYIELIDAQKKAVAQVKIPLDSATGAGSLFLSASLSSGHYILRAYTQWMKNFSPEAFFEQPLTVVNPFAEPETKRPSTPIPYDIQLLPEGGNLVAGLWSTVGVRATDPGGKGIDFTGGVINEAGDTVAHLRSGKFGLGKFAFRPESGHAYRVVVRDRTGKYYTLAAPAVREEGYVVHVRDTTADQVKITVTAKVNTGTPFILSVIHTRQVVVHSGVHFLQNGKSTWLIDKKTLREGVSHLTIFDSNMKPVCERLYFKPLTAQLPLVVTGLEATYGERKKIALTIAAGQKGVQANLSMAVCKADAPAANSLRMGSYLWLSSELQGTIESPEYYTDGPATPERQEAIDNLMLTHGWSRFSWGDLERKTSMPAYLPETGGPLIRGTVLSKSTHAPAPEVVTYLSSPGKPIRLFVCRSDREGRVLFELRDFFEKEALIAQTNTLLDSAYVIVLDNPYSEKPVTRSFPSFDFPVEWKTAVEQRAIHLQVANAFRGPDTFRARLTDSSAFYGKPDARYRLDSYTRFPTLEEVMREYIPEVTVRKHRDRFHFHNLNKQDNVFFEDDPLVLLDGVPVFDVDEILTFDPLKINTMEVMTQPYYLGPLSFAGIVSYSTYKNDLGGFSLNPKSLVINYEGLQRQREFFSPRYETPEQRNNTLPDTRNVLFWAPDIRTGSAATGVEFYSSDIAGTYRIVIQGISRDGLPAYFTTTFTVGSDDQ